MENDDAARCALPRRRAGESFDFEFQGTCFTATIGLYSDGRVGELFLNGLKLDTAQDVYACDLGKAISIALQYGAPLEALARTMTRDGAGRPRGLAGHVLDLMREMRG
ncbi:hypothetical protein [Methylosinus sp. Sm6]|uniref:hypothetical protein n=1 Tax=Methylosinus sp. Sm6 TaxID=2866948 RepID=UPI001C98F5AD|nr:hypothetical protein [Methylosinus sp. Sm6]MBY6239828.1 hypothetical protein [Methylosinus sp. Sm6]